MNLNKCVLTLWIENTDGGKLNKPMAESSSIF
jgi:hypothetical protein